MWYTIQFGPSIGNQKQLSGMALASDGGLDQMSLKLFLIASLWTSLYIVKIVCWQCSIRYLALHSVARPDTKSRPANSQFLMK